jgi:hypothetical protein
LPPNVVRRALLGWSVANLASVVLKTEPRRILAAAEPGRPATAERVLSDGRLPVAADIGCTRELDPAASLRNAARRFTLQQEILKLGKDPLDKAKRRGPLPPFALSRWFAADDRERDRLRLAR